ncbi:MAG: hypothetical protein GY702_09595 [Desulfobulbaceae bacterium]|nr:hypothetical protein [Desulfobulbaceae bacterium]
MNEIQFIESIDGSFPYYDKEKWKALIIKGAQISDNASFMVLHEICRAPKEVSVENQLKMLYEWDSNYTHPIKDLVIESGKSIIEGREISVERAIDYLMQISKFKGLYNALSIVYFSCNDTDDKADDVYNQITKEWESV